MESVNARQAILIGASLGIVCALVVWYLERFESNRLHSEVRHYLRNWDEFNEWLSSRNGKTEQ